MGLNSHIAGCEAPGQLMGLLHAPLVREITSKGSDESNGPAISHWGDCGLTPAAQSSHCYLGLGG